MGDEALLQAWRDGDAEAGRKLLARHFDGLCRFFRGKLDQDVEDLIQRTMLAALEYAERLKQAESFRAYLFTIARNQLHRHLSERAGPRGRIDFGVTSMVDLATSPSVAVARGRETSMVVDALRGLPADQQIALELFYWEEMAYAEIASVLGVHRDTIKRRLARGRKALRERLRALDRSADLEDEDLERWAKTAGAELTGAKDASGSD